MKIKFGLSIIGLTICILILFCNQTVKNDNYRNINISELGYCFMLPSKFIVDSAKGGTNVFICLNAPTKVAGIDRKPKILTKKLFLEKSKLFISTNYFNLNINKDTSFISLNFNNERYFFRLINTEYYNFFIWSKNDTLIKKIYETFKVDNKKLQYDFINHIDYEVKGDKIINFLSGNEILKRNEDNFFSINYKKDEFTEFRPLLFTVGSTLYNRSTNFFNICNIKPDVDSVGIKLVGINKNGQIKLIYKIKFKIEGRPR